MVRSFFRTLSVLFALSVVGGLVVGGGFLLFVLHGLPDVATLKTYHHDHASEVFSADGRLIGEFFTERRYPVTFSQVPPHVAQAFIAAEDSKFYQHKGIDFIAFGRAALTNLMEGRYAQGASTITQQVARGLLLESRRKKITRKVREMILAWRMEKALTKEAILALYLNDIFLGHRSYGIGAAARFYFKKTVEELTVAEGAMLAGLPQRPTYWNPFRNPPKSKRRQRYVLTRMVDEGYLTEVQANEAFAEPLTLYPFKSINSKEAPYFTELVRQHLNEKYGEENVQKQGYKVYTTVRYDFQKEAEKAVQKGLREVDKRLGWRGPIRQLADADSIEAYLTEAHEKILRKVTPARVLPAIVPNDLKRLLYDTSYFNEPGTPFFGSTPIERGEYYPAVVLEVWDEKEFAVASIGQTRVQIDLKAMNWVKIEDKPIKTVSELLNVGDVVEVKIRRIDRVNQVVTASLEQKPKIQGALLSYNVQTGFVEAMVGGRDFLESPFNRALQAKRQVGSIFKPLIFAAAVDKNFSPASMVADSPVVFKTEAGEDEHVQAGEDWRPRNYTERFTGELPLRQALIKSLNVPTIKLLNEIGVDYGIQYARTLGIKADFPRDLTIALGSWSSSLEEMMAAYSIFPRLGKPVKLVYIKKVVSASGEILEENLPDMEDVPLAERTTLSLEEEPETAETDPNNVVAGVGESEAERNVDKSVGSESESESESVTVTGSDSDSDSVSVSDTDTDTEPEIDPDRVISQQTAYVMTDMLKGVVREGTGWRARAVPGSVAGKTGTSQDFHDAWFVGYTPYVMSGVWVGFDQDVKIGPGEAGGRAAAPIWVDYMKKVAPQYPREDFPIPEDIVFASMNKTNGRLATGRTKTKERVRVAFKVGTVPNTTGANVRRVGEPGTRATTMTENPLAPNSPEDGDAAPPKAVAQPPEAKEELSDLLREGYQD